MLNISGSNQQPVAATFAEAVRLHTAGKAAEAERGYRQVLAAAPNHAEAWHMLGVLACQHGKAAVAVGCIERAVAIEPRKAVYRSNLSEPLRQLGREAEAEARLKEAIALDGRLADAYTNLAALYAQQGRHAESLKAAEALLAFMPGHANALRFKGDALMQLRRHAEAVSAYEAALAIEPGFADARFNAGCARLDLGDAVAAERDFRQVVATKPQDWDARLQLAEALERQGRGTQAYQELQRLTALNPQYGAAWSRMAHLLRNSDHVDEALAAYEQAVRLMPEDWITQSNMSFALRDQARLGEAMAIQRRLLEKHPTEPALHSDIIFSMQLMPGVTPEQVAREQAAWNRKFVPPGTAQRKFDNSADPDRRLKIGYLSADLRGHPVGWFMRPLVRHHDPSAVDVYCYATTRRSDGVTAEIADASRMACLTGMDDAAAEARIVADGIDILVDLNNHTLDNRMTLVARKPAPVVISYLAFNAGTGVETVDWRLTDGLVDPPASQPSADDAEAFERPLRLAETYWCYAAHPVAGAVMPSPAQTHGHVTFGSFNHFAKCNDAVLRLWAKVLARVAGSRLMMCVPTGSRQAHVRALFAAEGVAAERLTLVGRVSEAAYFANYGQVDVALDAFPWAGGTTTCDALYMGVPVVTLAGPVGRPLQRGGLSLLTHVGHPEWIAWTEAKYVEKAAGLGADVARLAAIRAGLRGEMERSVLMDAGRFARQVEDAYRRAWRVWCAGSGV